MSPASRKKIVVYNMYTMDLFTQLLEDGLPEPVSGVTRLNQIIRLNIHEIGGVDRYCPICRYYTRRSNYRKHLETERHVENLTRKILKEKKRISPTPNPTT